MHTSHRLPQRYIIGASSQIEIFHYHKRSFPSRIITIMKHFGYTQRIVPSLRAGVHCLEPQCLAVKHLLRRSTGRFDKERYRRIVVIVGGRIGHRDFPKGCPTGRSGGGGFIDAAEAGCGCPRFEFLIKRGEGAQGDSCSNSRGDNRRVEGQSFLEEDCGCGVTASWCHGDGEGLEICVWEWEARFVICDRIQINHVMGMITKDRRFR
mmetsp:Transcript_12036/g.19075  ORF Transcript_12036/g.19075 Transcript_12036/m.19075 type:complete len:208 (+) Transcript_12036:12-635(+)